MPLMVQIEVTGMTKLSDRQKRTIRREIVDFSFVLPALVVFVLVIILPLISGIRYTFTDWNGMAKQINFVGLKNYSTVLHDKDLIKPIVNTGLYTLITTVVINILGLTLAMMVTREFKGVNVIKSIVFIPLVVSLLEHVAHIPFIIKIADSLGANHVSRPFSCYEIIEEAQVERFAAVVDKCTDSVFLNFSAFMIMVMIVVMMVMMFMFVIIIIFFMLFVSF